MEFDPQIKPRLWNLKTGIVAYNCHKYGMPHPVLAMPMWEGAGNLARDYAGHGKNGIIDGAAWMADGLLFNSVTKDNVSIDSNWIALDTGKPYTVHASLELQSWGTGYPIYLHLRGNEGTIDFHFSSATSYLGIAFGSNSAAWANIKTDIPTSDLLNKRIESTVSYNGKGATTISNFKVFKTGIEQTLSTAGGFGSGNVNNLIGDRTLTGTVPWHGMIYNIYVFDVDISEKQARFLSANPYFMYQIPEESLEHAFFVPAGYTLIATSGQFGITGQNIELKKDSKLLIDSGEYNISGSDAELLKGNKLQIDSGSFGVTGQDVDFLRGLKIGAESEAYDLTGQSVSLFKGFLLELESGTYDLTGQNVTLTYTPIGGYTIIAGSGLYTIIGSALDLFQGYFLATGSGSFEISGNNVELLKSSKLSVDSGSFGVTGQDVDFLRGLKIGAESEAYDLTGQDVTLIYSENIYIDGCLKMVFSSKQPNIIFMCNQPTVKFTDMC